MTDSLSGHLILVVEDEPLVAIDIADAFTDAGAQVLTALTLEDAMKLVETHGLTAAVIDHALRDGLTTSDVCERLNELSVPFVVYSGFGEITGACAAGELVQKPASPGMLLSSLTAALSRQSKGLH
jgi:DNA-binding response OmpR family regulator